MFYFHKMENEIFCNSVKSHLQAILLRQFDVFLCKTKNKTKQKQILYEEQMHAEI